MVWSSLSQVAAFPPAVDILAAVPLGPYTAWWKFIPLLIVVLLWGRLVTWIDKDSEEVLLPRVGLNVGNPIGGIVAFAMFFLLPSYALGVLAMALIVAIEAGAYLGM